MDLPSCPLKNDLNQNISRFGIGYEFYKCMKKYENKVLQYLPETDEVDTYGEVLTRSIRAALKIKEKGVNRDDIISSCTHNHKNTVIPHFASLFLGIKTAHFDPNLSHLDTIHLLKLIEPKIIFVALESLPFLERCLIESKVNTELVVFGETEKYSKFSEYLEPRPEEDEFEPVKIADIKETATILFSSGTTGLPKGICLNHYGLLGQIVRNELSLKDKNDPVLLTYSTLYWVSCISRLKKCVTEGGSRVVCAKFNAADTWRLVEKYKVTSVFLAPHHAREILSIRQRNTDSSSLKYILTGSAPVTKELMRDLRDAFPTAKVGQVYGQTECSGLCAMFNVDDPEEMEMQANKPLSCGKVLAGLKWKVVDPLTEKILGPNERGELRYKSDYQMNGYYKIDSSDAYDSEGYIKSGDIVYYDDDECIYVIDRIKEMFKYKGWHIVPAFLEDILLRHPAVKEAVVVGIPHELDGDYPMGIVVLNAEHKDVSPEDIELYIEKIVPDTQRLRAGVKVVNEIVRTTTGKIKRSAMKEMVLNGEL